MSIAGFECRARYGSTPLAAVLPVGVSPNDDRVEAPEGVIPSAAHPHPVISGISEPWPYFLGRNKVSVKMDAETVLTVGSDPLLVLGHHGHGRVVAFTSDCSPHWGRPAFMAWPYYRQFWAQLVEWLAPPTEVTGDSEAAVARAAK